jgi:hypothetical protein
MPLSGFGLRTKRTELFAGTETAARRIGEGSRTESSARIVAGSLKSEVCKKKMQN